MHLRWLGRKQVGKKPFTVSEAGRGEMQDRCYEQVPSMKGSGMFINPDYTTLQRKNMKMLVVKMIIRSPYCTPTHYTPPLYTHTIHPHCTPTLYTHIRPHYTPTLYTHTVRPHYIPTLYTHTIHPHCTPTLYTHTVHPHCTPTLYAHTIHPHCTPTLYTHTIRPHYTPTLYYT